MTVAEQAKAIGKTIQINADGLVVEVKILDVKTAYGNVRYEVTAGLNKKWIDSSRVVAWQE